MTVAAKVELYVSKRPYIREALAEGIVNYSALARKIAEEESLENTGAIKTALTRYQDSIAVERRKRRNEVKNVIENTSLNVRSNVGVLKEQVENAVVSAQTSNGYTSVVQEGDKALISLESPQQLEDTPGVLEFILSSIASRGINVDHVISCREDTHLIVEEDKAPEVLELLQERIS